MISYPETLQIEPTNQCNFRCSMCLQSVWSKKRFKYVHMPKEKFEKIAKEAFSHVKRLVLYGWGEPFFHPEFLDLLHIARRYLSENSEIVVTSNGSLLTREIVDEILDNHLIDELIISCEGIESNASNHGHSLDQNTVHQNLIYLLSHKKRKNIRVGIETLIMRSNYKLLPEFVKFFSQMKVDFIVGSHVYPYLEHMKNETLYALISKEALSALEEIGDKGWELILEMTKEQWGLAFAINYEAKPASNQYLMLLQKTKEKQVLPNIPLYMRIKDSLPMLEELEEVFAKAQSIAKQAGVELELPPIFPVYEQRKCPYVEKNAAVIRADGEVAPCFKDMYDHQSFLSYHARPFSAYSFGNVFEQSLKAIWMSPEYVEFRERMNNMNETIPYCGDCPLSSNNCFYAIEDETDCYGNLPFCAECPYSVDLTRCIL
ncbi:MAG: radical SAM protein [Candidatus Heimdallarchaeaceae archaeon]